MTEQASIGMTIDRSRHTVLVVDDNPATRYATARVLRAGGFKTLEAVSGEDALAMCDGSLSAVVLDVNLPGISGLEVCQRLRSSELNAVLPVIHLSAIYIDNVHKVAGLNAGADAYLTHPAEPAVLIATVQALIRARLAEERLRRSEARFRAIYAQAQSGIALINEAGAFVDANPAMLAMLGRSAGEVLGRPISDFAPPQWRDFVREKTSSNQELDTLWQCEIRLSTSGGAAVQLEWTMSPKMEDGLRVGVATDVSERERLERRRQALLEREQAARVAAERHSQTKDNFVAVLSHELRNPLNAMLMTVHVLHRRAAGLPEIVSGLDSIEKNARMQARIISDILDVSRINSGKLQLAREYADPAALIRASVEGMHEAVQAAGVQVALHLPTGSAPFWLDPARFQQIFWNVFANAVKFSERGGAIEVAMSQSAYALSVTVRDEGRGIEPGFIEHIFDKFAQDRVEPGGAHGGLGLGMAIVKNLVDLHSGMVTVKSDGVGKGTTVRLEFPATDAGGPARSPESIMGQTSDEEADRLDGLDVLVVEDDAQAREMLAVILSDRGARVMAAGDFDAALREYEARPPQVLLSDIGLPGRDGCELMREIRRREEKKTGTQPVLAIALTAFGRAQDRMVAISAGFDAHLSKPLVPHKLIASISRLHAQRAAR